jgi:signal transduction histidine kinase
VIALLVLENDLVPGVFTPGRLGALELLAAQAAISIENARLLKEAQDSIRVRDTFLALASHELRTPLTSLMLTAQRLRGGAPGSSSESLRRALTVFDKQLGRLKALIDDMMSVGQILLGRLELNADLIDLAAIVRDEVQRSAPAFESAGCSVTVRADRPVRGRWDRDKVAQVVEKLLANAIKFGAGAPIEVGVEGLDGTARLVVVDHGTGIEPGALPHIFGRFERAASPSAHGGLGIGLYIVEHLVRALGGTVCAESTPHVETRFTVELPR